MRRLRYSHSASSSPRRPRPAPRACSSRRTRSCRRWRWSTTRSTIAIDDQVADHHRRADLPQPHRPAARSDLPLPGAQGRERQQVHHVGGRQGDDRRTARRQEGPPDLHRHRPPHAGPRPARVHRQQPAAAAGLPGPAEGRPEGDAQLHLRRPAGQRPRRVRLPAEDRRQGDQDARGVLDQGDDQVAAPDPERLQPDARHHADAQGRQGSGDRRSSATRPCSTRTSSSSTASATRTSA